MDMFDRGETHDSKPFPMQQKLLVCVRLKPLVGSEEGRAKATRPLDDKVVVVLPKKESIWSGKNAVGHRGRHQSEHERSYAFDLVADSTLGNRSLYERILRDMVEYVQRGYNVTVFTYGATGSGKTHTMIGSSFDPGLIPLAIDDLFALIETDNEYDNEVTCSFLEVYNETIYDLTQQMSSPLELREGPGNESVVAGLVKHKVSRADAVRKILTRGSTQRRTEATDANETSSRSHAVFEVTVKRGEKHCYAQRVTCGKLTMIDLAGAERAKHTQNGGRQLRDGANINNSLLALANCITALGKNKDVHIPFRNSKLTRLLKDALCGNSRTIMIANVSSSTQQYEHIVNTLKYADRAKGMKTHVTQNTDDVRLHVTEYQRLISELRKENKKLREQNNDLKAIMLQDNLLYVPDEDINCWSMHEANPTNGLTCSP